MNELPDTDDEVDNGGADVEWHNAENDNFGVYKFEAKGSHELKSDLKMIRTTGMTS